MLALADRMLPKGVAPPERREEAERDLCFLGLVGRCSTRRGLRWRPRSRAAMRRGSGSS